jgi:uncharacterized protein YqgQ
MKNFYDVQQLLKKFGAIIYLGNRLDDIDMMEEEIKELYRANMIELDIFKTVLIVLSQERQKELKNRKR